MKLPSTFNARQLLQMLEVALQKEHDHWKPHSFKNQPLQTKAGEVTSAMRDETVQWFSQLNRHFKFYPETFFLSTTMLDKVLQSVKAHPKYLKCIGIACFYVAAKTLEEDEMVPSTLRFVQQSGCGCSVAEVLRMERRILDILGWNLRLATPLDFLHIFHASLLSGLPHLLDGGIHMSPGRQLSLLTHKLEAVMLHHTALSYAPSLLALAVVSLEIQQFLPQWFTVTHIMQKHIQVSDEELISCTEQVSRILGLYHISINTTYNKSKKSCKSGTPTKKRKVAESDDDDIYDGIKRLYSDDPDTSMTTVAMGTCGIEHRQEDSTNITLASLQAVAN